MSPPSNSDPSKTSRPIWKQGSSIDSTIGASHQSSSLDDIRSLRNIKRARVKRADLDDVQRALSSKNFSNAQAGVEDKWQEEQQKKEKSIVGFVSFVVGLLLLGIVGILYVNKKREQLTSGRNQQQEIESIVRSDGESMSMADAKKHVGGIETVLRGYFESDSLVGAKNWVRSPERVGPLMDEYYSRSDKNFEKLGYDGLVNFVTIDLQNKPCIIALANTSKGVHKILLEKIQGDEFKIDWETHVRYQPIEWEEYLKQSPTESLSMRVVVRPDAFPVGSFTDTEKYACYRISQSVEHEHIFGYVDKGSDLNKKIQARFRDRTTRVGNFSEMILQLRWSSAGKEYKQVLIEDIVSGSWVYLAD